MAKPRKRRTTYDEGAYRRAFCDCPNCMEHDRDWPVYYVGSGRVVKWHRGKRKVLPISYSFECYLELRTDIRKPQPIEAVAGRCRAIARADDPAFPAMVDGCPGCDGYGMRPRGKTYCMACAHRLGIDLAAELADEIEIAETTESVSHFAVAMGTIRYYGQRIKQRRLKLGKYHLVRTPSV